MRHTRPLLAIAISLAIAACGGGATPDGAGTDAAASPPAAAAQAVDAVSGTLTDPVVGNNNASSTFTALAPVVVPPTMRSTLSSSIRRLPKPLALLASLPSS